MSKPPTILMHQIPIRPGLIVHVSLPADLTLPEAERFAGVIRSLAFADPTTGSDRDAEGQQ